MRKLFYIVAGIITLCVVGCASQTIIGTNNTTQTTKPAQLLSGKSYSISGKISYTGKAQGDIYVLAFQNLEKLRDALSKYNVPNLDLFVSYAKINHKGNYKIKGLKPGNSYFIYAWMDKNKDKDVDFDLLEPTGWYQKDSAWGKITVNDNNISGIDINLKTVTPYPKKDISVKVDKKYGGTLKTIKGKKVLDVWGPPSARGYAQGYLVGPQIRDTISYLMVEYFAGSASHYEKDIRPWVKKHLVWTNTDMKELNGIIKGMKDSKCNMYLPEVNRDVDVIDLMCINSYTDAMYVPNCSAAAVWGPLTKNSELKSGVIMFRSQDGENDFRKTSVLLGLIMVQEPLDSSKNKWASVMMFPGCIGTLTGMNEFGVVMEGNYAAGRPSPIKKSGYTPMSILIRDVLITADHKNTEADVMSVNNKLSKKTTTGGPIIGGLNGMVAAPYYGQKIPVFVYEVDAYGATIRNPTDDIPIGPYTICTTNHFRKYEQNYPNTDRRKETRYAKLYRALDKLESDNYLKGTTVTIKTFHKRICISSNKTTEQAFIFLPNARIIMVAYEDLKSKNSNAMESNFSTYKLDDLFHYKGR
ncbi:MAG TPA: hypothetical protein QF753_05280 [Victivallales bacterium]|nr:hypothetical protein [Victivallales bacterium]